MSRKTLLSLITGLAIAAAHCACAFAAPLRVNSTTPGSQMNPALASQGDNIYVAWQSKKNGEWNIRFAASANGGRTFGADICLSCRLETKEGFQPIHHEPAVAAAPGGRVYVVWQGITDDIDYDIFFTSSRDGGKTFSVPARINSHKPGNQQFPSIAATAEGSLVSWQDNREGPAGWQIYVASVSRHGKNSSGDILVSKDSPAALNTWSRAAAAKSGRAAIVWQCGGDVCYSATPAPGAPFPPAKKAFAQPADRQFPAPAFSADGTLFLAYAGSGAARLDAYAAKLLPSGDFFSPPVKISSETAFDQTQPAVAALPDGSFAAAWVDTRNPGDLAVFVNTFAVKNGSVQPLKPAEIRIDSPSPIGFSERPALAATAKGTVLAVWADDQPGDYDIYFDKLLLK